MENIKEKNYCKYCGDETKGFCCRHCWDIFEADGCYGDEEEEEEYDEGEFDDNYGYYPNETARFVLFYFPDSTNNKIYIKNDFETKEEFEKMLQECKEKGFNFCAYKRIFDSKKYNYYQITEEILNAE